MNESGTSQKKEKKKQITKEQNKFEFNTRWLSKLRSAANNTLEAKLLHGEKRWQVYCGAHASPYSHDRWMR